MKSLEALYFPDTTIISDDQSPLFLLFNKIHLLLPVEKTETDKEHLSDYYVESGLCQLHTPHPLGDDLDRFLFLINDLKNRKDDYAAQLSNLTLASLSTTQSHNQDTAASIKNSLLNTNPSLPSSDKEQKEGLWQARLVLKIAEILDKEEVEVAQALVELESTESRLFDELKGINGDEDTSNLVKDLDRIRTKLTKPKADAVEKRFRAWFKLIRNAELPQCKVWCCNRPEAAEILFENYAIMNDVPPRKIAVIPLPARVGTSREDVVSKVNVFTQMIDDCRFQLLSGLERTDSHPFDNDLAEIWQNSLDTLFPANDYGRTTLDLYQFSRSLAHFSGLEGAEQDDGPKFLALLNIGLI